ncbi:MAG: Lrp/AsnC family transcriptional regulator, regulator for asnA, asnC and gidA [Gaiellales bacterium]|jgi:Lrp/AsnC family transcriptional regulator for asnA, asnC and gidA|nr:Lrp/AsnC family transcriptional regulator, regulator for asnA, asnC and gidA [Gaiellales bacterium]
MPSHVDDVDLAIIGRLQTDGRASVKSMSDEIGLSEATIRKRLGRLLEEGLIQIAAIPNARESRQTIMAMANIRATGDVEALGRTIASWPETSWVALGAGNVDLAVEMVCPGRDALQDVVKRLQSLDGVTHLQTFVYLKTLKQAYFGPLTRSE